MFGNAQTPSEVAQGTEPFVKVKLHFLNHRYDSFDFLRYSKGVYPVFFLNIFPKYGWSLNPQLDAISPIE